MPSLTSGKMLKFVWFSEDYTFAGVRLGARILSTKSSLLFNLRETFPVIIYWVLDILRYLAELPASLEWAQLLSQFSCTRKLDSWNSIAYGAIEDITNAVDICSNWGATQ
jgi:hypothetical protein